MNTINRQTIKSIELINSANKLRVELAYFPNSGVWQVTDMPSGWCGNTLFNPRIKNHKIKAFREWVKQRNSIERENNRRLNLDNSN